MNDYNKSDMRIFIGVCLSVVFIGLFCSFIIISSSNWDYNHSKEPPKKIEDPDWKGLCDEAHDVIEKTKELTKESYEFIKYVWKYLLKIFCNNKDLQYLLSHSHELFGDKRDEYKATAIDTIRRISGASKIYHE